MMDGRSQTVKVVLICGAVVFGGWQMLKPPTAKEFDDRASQLMWQAEDPVLDPAPAEKSVVIAPVATAQAPPLRPMPAVRSLPAPAEESGPFASTGWLAVEQESVAPKRTPAVADSPTTKPVSTREAASSAQEMDLSLDLSMKSSRFGLQENSTNSVTGNSGLATEKPLAEIMQPSLIRDNAINQTNNAAANVDRASPFVTASARTAVASFQTGNVPSNSSAPMSTTMPEQVASSRPSTVGGPAAKPANQRQAPAANPVVEQRALEHLEYGKSLARRGASFAAREEFVQALRLIAESYDMQTQSREYTTNLADGLRALNEADDFVLMDAEQQLNIDMAQVIATHSSKVIPESMASNMSPIYAMQMYFQYSTGKISAAAGRSVAAAEVLHAMGKLLQTSSQYDAAGRPIDRAKAIVMYQAALDADPSDYRSANELGVLLAQNGKWEMAKEMFARSLVIRKSPESWLNLAKVHEQLGEQEFARQANAEYRQLAGTSSSSSNMEWVSAQQFESQGVMPDVAATADVPKTAQQPPVEPESRGNKIINGIKKWF